VRLGDGDAVELLEEIGDAPALEHDGAAGDLGGVRGEDGRDADFFEEIMGFGGGDAGFAEAAEGSTEIAALGWGVLIELGRETAPLAVVGFGEIDELEVETEGSGELVGGGEIVGVGVDAGQGLLESGTGGDSVGFGVSFATGDGGAAKVFDGGIEGVAGLLAEDFAEEHAEGADITAEGSFFELAGRGLEFCEAFGPVGG
jgi:hypothetical protein